MNAAAYDISHLLACEPPPRAAVEPRPSLASAPVAVVEPAAVGIMAAQEAMARELLQLAEHHEAFIQQYLSMAGDVALETFWH